MNHATALSRVDGDSSLLAELAAIFIDEYPLLLEEVRDSIIQDDHSGFERAAHTLKGRLDFFAIDEMHDLALRLEIMGRARDWNEAHRTLKLIETGMANVLHEFELLARISHRIS